MPKSLKLPFFVVLSFSLGATASYLYLNSAIEKNNKIYNEILQTTKKYAVNLTYYRAIDSLASEVSQLESLVAADEMGEPRDLQIINKAERIKQKLEKLMVIIKDVDDPKTINYAQSFYKYNLKLLKEVEYNYSSSQK